MNKINKPTKLDRKTKLMNKLQKTQISCLSNQAKCINN